MMDVTGVPPPIVLTRTNYERLSDLAPTVTQQATAVRQLLGDELARAQIVEAADIAPTVVTMNSDVEFRDDQAGLTRRVTLVYPGEEDIAQARISVLTPIGAALIGLSEGQSAEWETRSGEWKSLTVLKVHFQPEASGRGDH